MYFAEFNETMRTLNYLYSMNLEENRGKRFAIAVLIEDTYLHNIDDFNNVILALFVAEEDSKDDKIFIGELKLINRQFKIFNDLKEKLKIGFPEDEFIKLENRIEAVKEKVNSMMIGIDPRC
ncbi:Imm3 family immunity protein [Clostridium sp. B9]|uniref:Imm3 family immunity protein n=1 Tax=Clostridium sp. B9 TaxID=3423224 RepID=UPI003D2F2170